jgi:hypothetical protein
LLLLINQVIKVQKSVPNPEKTPIPELEMALGKLERVKVSLEKRIAEAKTEIERRKKLPDWIVLEG